MPAAALHEMVHRLAHALPTQCAICRAWQAEIVCAGCLGDPSARIGTPRGVARSSAGVPCAATVPYAFPWDGLVTEFKFGGQTAWARHWADWMLKSAEVREALSRTDALVPMPLSRQRLCQRGYNQASLLARELGQAWRRICPAAGLPVIDGVLLRTRDTAPQAGLSRSERLANLRGALQVDPLQSRQLADLRLAVVDDVVTTGASLQAAAEALRAAGAASVSGLVFAQTEYD